LVFDFFPVGGGSKLGADITGRSLKPIGSIGGGVCLGSTLFVGTFFFAGRGSDRGFGWFLDTDFDWLVGSGGEDSAFTLLDGTGVFMLDNSDGVSFFVVSIVFRGIPIFLGINGSEGFGFSCSFFFFSTVFLSCSLLRSPAFFSLPTSFCAMLSAAFFSVGSTGASNVFSSASSSSSSMTRRVLLLTARVLRDGFLRF
jgi:hypothetical protein